MKYRLVQYLVSALRVPTIGPLRAADIINFCSKKNLHYHRIKPMTHPPGHETTEITTTAPLLPITIIPLIIYD